MNCKENGPLLTLLAIQILLCCALSISQPVVAQEITPDVFKQLRYRHIGPPGNRVAAVAGVPGDPFVYYAGAATGGVFKTIDGGINWTPIFDDQKTLTMGALAVAPSDANIVWAGTGETWIRNNARWQPIGDGIYKSSDGGKTWIHAGLEKTGRIGRIIVHPQDPNIVFAAAMGHCYGPQAERGVFRSQDGGKTWNRVLFVDENTGCADIAMDPKKPRVLYAGMWQTFGETSGGPGSGLYRSQDGGETWKKLSGNGLPEPPLGKIGVAVAASNPSRVYALIETGMGLPRLGKAETSRGVLWKSDDGGENWTLMSCDLALAGRKPYYTRCAVAPDNQDEIYFLDVALTVSTDSGKTTKRIGTELHGDHHDIWIDPTNGSRIIESNDQGVGISSNRGRTWQAVNLPTAQMHRVTVDNQIPYYVYGSLQDMPSHRGPSNSRTGRTGISRGMWHAVGGSEAGFMVPDPADNSIIWSPGHPGGALDVYDLKTGHIRSVDLWPDDIWDWADADLKYRFNRTYPIVVSIHDHNKVYIGSQFVHQTTDGGQNWKTISPDLTTNDTSKQQYGGGLTPDSSGNEDCVLFALAESPLKAGLLWTGSNDGLVHVTQDGGAHWTNITANIAGLPPGGTIMNIEPSKYDEGACYITVNLHELNDRNPYVYKTSDYGRSWKSISSDLPKSTTYSANARCLREDPVRKGMLYLGTENAIYVSFNDGSRWIPLQTNMPHAPAHWLVVQEHFNDLVVGTYGRGFWILDDITPLQQLSSAVLGSAAHLFAPRPAYRFHSVQAPLTVTGDHTVGENPPAGASIHYYLKAAGTAPVKIMILDETGRTVRTLEGPKERGINRVWWDFMSEPSTEVRLRTSPLRAPWITIGEQGWRPYPSRGGRMSILMPPGTYTVRLSAGGTEFSQKLLVKKDPRSAGSEADISAQIKLLTEVQSSLEGVAEMINQLEWIRKQVQDIQGLLLKEKEAESVTAAGKMIEKKIISIEDKLYEMSRTGRGSDTYRGPSRIISKPETCVKIS